MDDKAISETELASVDHMDKELESEFGKVEDNMPKKMYAGPVHGLAANRRFRHDVEMIASGERISHKDKSPRYFWDVEELREITGIQDIDKILCREHFELKKTSWVVYMWGCSRCWMRGTDECPHGIKPWESHANGYCDKAIGTNLLQYKLMSKPSGMKHIRNVNLGNLMNMCNAYLSKLKDKASGSTTKEEMWMLKNVLRMQKEIRETLDKAISQEEGIKVRHEGDFTVDDFNRLMQRSNEHIVEADIVKEEVEGDGDSGTENMGGVHTDEQETVPGKEDRPE